MDSFPTAISFHVHHHLFSPTLSKHKLHPAPKTLSTFSNPSLLKSSSPQSNHFPITPIIKTIATGALILSTTTANFFSHRHPLALADPLPSSSSSTLDIPKPDANSLLYQKLEEGNNAEALSILRRLMAEHPAESEWKFLASRLLNEMGQAAESRQFLEQILAVDPLSFEALFQIAVLMDRCGDGDAAIQRLELALELARSEHKEDAARDVRLIMAQIQYLQRKVEEALSIYDELAREDPEDCRPFFCQGVIYTLLDRHEEAREKFGKCRELSEKKAEVNAYLQTPLSRVRLFGTGDSGI